MFSTGLHLSIRVCMSPNPKNKCNKGKNQRGKRWEKASLDRVTEQDGVTTAAHGTAFESQDLDQNDPSAQEQLSLLVVCLCMLSVYIPIFLASTSFPENINHHQLSENRFREKRQPPWPETLSLTVSPHLILSEDLTIFSFETGS